MTSNRPRRGNGHHPAQSTRTPGFEFVRIRSSGPTEAGESTELWSYPNTPGWWPWTITDEWHLCDSGVTSMEKPHSKYLPEMQHLQIRVRSTRPSENSLKRRGSPPAPGFPSAGSDIAP